MVEELALPKGRVRGYQGEWIKTPWVSNLVLREWGGIVGKLLTLGSNNYRISTMYLEFENVPVPNTPVSIPVFDRDPPSGVSYYNGLITSLNRDYLRVPMIAGILDSTDQILYPNGNLLTFFAQTSGVVGVHGKPFSDANNSVVFGGALVATPDVNDATQDLILSRFYFPVADQQPKLPTGQIGLEWELTLL